MLHHKASLNKLKIEIMSTIQNGMKLETGRKLKNPRIHGN